MLGGDYARRGAVISSFIQLENGHRDRVLTTWHVVAIGAFSWRGLLSVGSARGLAIAVTNEGLSTFVAVTSWANRQVVHRRRRQASEALLEKERRRPRAAKVNLGV